MSGNKKKRNLTAEIEKKKKELATLRDELRELIDEAEEIIESCDKGERALQDAVDALSEYV